MEWILVSGINITYVINICTCLYYERKAVTFTHFNLHVHNYHKSEHVLHVLRKFHQIPY